MDNSVQFCNFFLTNSHIKFIRRQANEVAYELAKADTLFPSFHIFDESPAYI